jgi:hypothetical protein
MGRFTQNDAEVRTLVENDKKLWDALDKLGWKLKVVLKDSSQAQGFVSKLSAGNNAQEAVRGAAWRYHGDFALLGDDGQEQVIDILDVDHFLPHD